MEDAMMAQIKNFLRSLSEIPEGKFPPSHYTPISRRSINWANFAYIAALAWVAIYALVFSLLKIYVLAIIQSFAIPVYIAVFILHRKGYFLFAHFIDASLTITLNILLIFVLGWEAGFQYVMIVLSVTLFYTPWRAIIKVCLIGTYLITYFCMYFYSLSTSPLIAIDPIYLKILYQTNIMLVSTVLAFVVYIYYKMAIKSDKKLFAEHQKTMTALKERDQLLEQLNNELSEAADYVKKILPQPLTEGAIRTNWRFIPSTSLGGDAFGYHKVDEENFALYLIDVSGHGVGAALLSASVINVIRSQSLPKTDFKDPVQVLKALNSAFPSDSNKDMFFTIWYGVFNTNSRELTYASAGHPPAILCDENNSCECNINLLKTPNFVVGGIEGTNYVKDKCKIFEGNTLYIFSDGVYEVEKSDGTTWSYNEFVNYIKQVKTDGKAVMDRLYDYVRRKGKSDNIEDDFTFLEVVFG
jgi:sigma-B regulation protein RsbU (phosphoserine phosphatase)